MHATAVLVERGHIVIPPHMRAAMGLTPGDCLHLDVSGQRLIIERLSDPVAALGGLGSSFPMTRSLVEELLAERRLAASNGD